MQTIQQLPVKKAFLYVLIGAVGLTAALGILAILAGRFGWLELRILLTTIAIAAASICGLSCGAYWNTGRGLVLPIAGLAVTLLAAVLILGGIWTTPVSIGYWKLSASAAVFAVACAHLSLLSMARLAQWFQWSLTAAHVVILGVASLVVLLILGQVDSVGMFQLLAVAAICDAAITVMIPIFHRLSKGNLAEGTSGPEADGLNALDREIAALRLRLEELERQRAQSRSGG